MFLGEHVPPDDKPWSLAALRADGAPLLLAGTIGAVAVGQPMTMILYGLVPVGTTCRTTTAVTRIEPWLESALDAIPSRSETGPL